MVDLEFTKDMGLFGNLQENPIAVWEDSHLLQLDIYGRQPDILYNPNFGYHACQTLFQRVLFFFF